MVCLGWGLNPDDTCDSHAIQCATWTYMSNSSNVMGSSFNYVMLSVLCENNMSLIKVTIIL